MLLYSFQQILKDVLLAFTIEAPKAEQVLKGYLLSKYHYFTAV